MNSMTHPAPRLRATLYTDEISIQPQGRGYRRGGMSWAVVSLGADFQLTAVDDEGLAGMQRLIDALTAAIAQARQAEQDEALTDIAEAEAVA